ncbi:MAG: tripartite tricarboxylate transporter substrate binding protein [Deltaproteobacteria bacterium]|nr:tripartite tricarboxylate transporter substrate binding protein [Deltaproteobacteria bacterium]
MKDVKIILVLITYLFLAGYAHDGFAQNYPTKPIRVIVPFAAGGSNDLIARSLQKPLGKELKGTIVVENISAGTTKLGTLEVMKAEPDGHTLLFASHGALMGYFFSGTYDFRVWEKLTIIAQSGEMPYGFLEVRSDSPFKTWADLVSFAKKNPGKLTCGGPGAGGLMNLNVIETAKKAGIVVKYVPFAGAGPSGIALLGGHVDYRVCLPPEAYPNIKAGKTRGLAISYGKRLPEMPDVPTFKELGLMDVTPPLSYDFWGPANLPKSLVNQISKAVEKAIEDPGYLDFCRRILYQPIFKDVQALKEDIKIFEEKVGPLLEVTFPKK